MYAPSMYSANVDVNVVNNGDNAVGYVRMLLTYPGAVFFRALSPGPDRCPRHAMIRQMTWRQ